MGNYLQLDMAGGAERPMMEGFTTRRYADIGVDEVQVMPFTGDPVAFVNGLGDHVVGQLDNLR